MSRVVIVAQSVGPRVAREPKKRQNRAIENKALAHPAVTRHDIFDKECFLRPPADPVLNASVSSSSVLEQRERLEREFNLDLPTPLPARAVKRKASRLKKASAEVCSSVRLASRQTGQRSPPKRRFTRLPTFPDKGDGQAAPDQRTLLAAAFLEALEDDLSAGAAKHFGKASGRTALEMHMHSIQDTRVLTRGEERALFKIFNRCCAYGLSRTDVASDSELEAASAQHGVSVASLQIVQQQSHAARALLMRYNERLVVMLARRFGRNTGSVLMDDVIPEGQLGLLTAMLKFDPARGFKFSTYAVWHIRQRVQKAVQLQSRIIHVPAHIQDMLPKVLRARAQLQAMKGADAEVTDEAVGAALGMKAAKVRTIEKIGLPLVRLDDLLDRGNTGGDEGEGTVLDTLVDDSQEIAAEAERRDAVVRECLNGVLQSLQPRERNIIRLRYGLNAERRRVSLPEIAEAYGLSGERIRQIEEDAVRKLMVPWRRQALMERADCLF